jgi:hypothetical protein
MAGEELGEIGRDLGVSPGDIEVIRRERRRLRFLAPLAGAIVAIVSTILGFLNGRSGPIKLVSSETGAVYPFAIPAFILTAAAAPAVRRDRRSTALIVTAGLTIFLSLVGYAVAYDMARPVQYYTGSIMYGVRNVR